MSSSITQSSYAHISGSERHTIAVLRHMKASVRTIAAQLGRSPSTISRELRRNGGKKVYDDTRAQHKARIRWHRTHHNPRLASPILRDTVIRMLKEGCSPEQIAGRLRRTTTLRTNYESIYRYIYDYEPTLAHYLHTRHRTRKKRRSTKHVRAPIPYKVPISERGTIDGEYGHWEVDLVGSSSKATVATLIEKKTRMTYYLKIPNKHARTLYYAIRFLMRHIPAHMRKSITYDNGSENALHYKINEFLGTRSYFCTPYHAWEKGQVEYSIRLLRRYYPKRTNFYTIKGADILEVQHMINNLPRKCLNFATPLEAFTVALSH